MATVKERMKTPPRPRGPRAAGINPRKGEDRLRGGHKSYEGDPDGMKPTQPRQRSRIDRKK